MFVFFASVLPKGAIALLMLAAATGGEQPVPWTTLGIIAALATGLVAQSRWALSQAQESANKDRERGDRLETILLQFMPALQTANSAGAKQTEALVAATGVLKDVLDDRRRTG